MKKLIALSAAGLLGLAANSAGALAAGGEHHEIERQPWSFSGFRGQFDKAQLQRGFQVYQNVCSNCHGLSRVRFRNLVEPAVPSSRKRR